MASSTWMSQACVSSANHFPAQPTNAASAIVRDSPRCGKILSRTPAVNAVQWDQQAGSPVTRSLAHRNAHENCSDLCPSRRIAPSRGFLQMVRRQVGVGVRQHDCGSRDGLWPRGLRRSLPTGAVLPARLCRGRTGGSARM